MSLVFQLFPLGFLQLFCQRIMPIRVTVSSAAMSLHIQCACSGVPLIKEILTDSRSNYDGLAQTCSYLHVIIQIFGVIYGANDYPCGSQSFGRDSVRQKDLPLSFA